MTAPALTDGTAARAAHDALALAWRSVKHHARVPSLLVFSLATPMIFLLLFRYVLGGSIVIPGSRYVDFLVPGVLVQSIAFGATQTGVGLALDVGRGITDRFRSLPMSRSAVPAGRVIVDAARNTLVAVSVVGIGALTGFLPHGDALALLSAIALAVAFGGAFSWVAAFVGLTVRHAEAVHDAGFVWVIPLTFTSSALVSVDAMPAGVRWAARVNPLTSVTDAVRDLMLGRPAGTSVLHAVAWVAALVIVFAPLAVRAYQRR